MPKPHAKKKTSLTARGPVTEANVVASGIKYDKKSLNLKSASQITIHLDNKDAGVPHTFTVWKSEADATKNNTAGQIANTGTFSGTKDLQFKTDGPATWYFNCTIHPTSMFGSITVSAGGATSGGGGAASGPTTTPKVVAKGIKFDVSKLTLKANSPITVWPRRKV